MQVSHTFSKLNVLADQAEYRISQRICRQNSWCNRLFLAGDAVHIHSPKAGQGMNVSMQDAYNLGWKLASVVLNVLRPSILDTYQQERLEVAERLIKFNKHICGAMCRAKDRALTFGSFDDDHKDALEDENTAEPGLSVAYSANMLTDPLEHARICKVPLFPGSQYIDASDLALNLKIGARIPNQQVIGQSDAQPRYIHDLIPSTGEWNLLVFAGDISMPVHMQRLLQLSDAISQDRSPISRLNQRRSEGNLVGTMAMILIHSAPGADIELLDLPGVFRPSLKGA